MTATAEQIKALIAKRREINLVRRSTRLVDGPTANAIAYELSKLEEDIAALDKPKPDDDGWIPHRVANLLDPEVMCPSDDLLLRIHADLEVRGRKDPAFAVSVHHRNIVLSAVANALRLSPQCTWDKWLEPESQPEDGMTPWSGGERPVSAETEVTVRLRDGTTFTKIARFLFWDHSPADLACHATDIVAYKIVEPKP